MNLGLCIIMLFILIDSLVMFLLSITYDYRHLILKYHYIIGMI